MKESVAIAKEADTMSSPTKSDKSSHRVRDEPERQLGSLRSVIDSIRSDGGTPSVDSIATELSSLHTAQRAPALLALQQTHGNRYVQRVVAGIQAKLRIGQPGDVYEQEADRVAEQVMRMPEPEVQLQPEDEEKLPAQAKTITPIQALTIHRQDDEEEEELKKKKKEEEEEETLQAKELLSHLPEVTPEFESHIHALKGGGQPLPESVRTFFEPRFGYDFSQVRVHTDAQAAESARTLSARALTVGHDVVFGAGQYAPETTAGQRLLAHELTHAVQQGSAKINGSYHSVLQRFPEGATATEAVVTPAEKKKVYPPVNWGIDHAKRRILAIPKAGVSLDEVAQFLYGSTSATTELASVNEISPTAPLVPGRPLRLTGKKLTGVAYNHLKASPKVPAGVRDPEAFLAKKKTLDNELEKDFNFIVNKLDESHYSDSDEGQVISILKKWGEEKFTTNPKLYPNGGEYLDKLFSKLTRKRKDVGIITTQWTNYYSLIFNHFDRVAEVKSIRDRYSRLFTGESGLKELSFGSFFWKEVKEGRVRDQIFAYFKGLGKGVWSGAKGTVMMAYTLITDPKKFISDLANLPGALKTLWEKRSELWNKFAKASPEEQAEMIGEVFGEIEFMIASSAAGAGAAKGIEKLSQAPGKIGKIAKAAQVVTKLPKTAMGAVAKGVKTVVLKGGRIAAEGAIFAAKGIYKVGEKILGGTWSVVEKTVEKITRKFYYFYDDAERVLREIPAKFAKECVICTACKLTAKAKKAETIEEFVARGGKIEKLPPGPKPSKFAEELEELLIGSTGESMLGSDPVLRNLLAVKGTFTHATFNRLAKKLKLLMPENSLFLPKDWSGLEKLLGKRLPWKHGQGPDLILVDRSSGKIAIVDLTRKFRPSHIKKTMDYARDFRKRFPDWSIPPDLVRDIYYGGSKTVGKVLDEQLKPLLTIFGGKG